MEPARSGGRFQVPILIQEREGGDKARSNPAGRDKHREETFKPFTRKLTYTLPLVESKQTTSQHKVFPPKSPKKIQFRDDERRSNVFSTNNIIKDQSKPTPPDVDYEERPQYRVKKSNQDPQESSAVNEIPWNAQDEADRSIKKIKSGPAKVRSFKRSHETFLLTIFSLFALLGSLSKFVN